MEGKFAPGEKEEVLSKVTEVENWMNSNSNAETEEYEAKQKDLERVFSPIASKLYQGAEGQRGGNNGYPSQQQAGNAGPQVDEVD